MYKSKKYCALLLICFLLFVSVCSCKKADPDEQTYISDEIVSVEQRKVDKSDIGEDSMKVSGDLSKNDTKSSEKQDNSKKISGNSNLEKNVETYKYEYEFFDKRYYANSVLSSGNPARIKNVLRKAKSGKKVTVAFIGGSITEGTGATKDDCYAVLVAKWFEKTFNNTKVEYVNAGIGTAGSLFGVHRVDYDVISRNPDIVFVDFAVNDKGKNPDLENATFDALIQKLYNSPSKPAVVSVAMATETTWNSEKNENLICRNYGIPMLSFSKYIHTVILSGKYLWKDVFIDEVHPNKAGHKMISELVIYYLEKTLGEIDKKDSFAPQTIDKPYIEESARYLSAKRLNPIEIKLLSNNGFSAVNSVFQKTDGFFESKTQNAEISFSVKTKTLTLFYGKLPGVGGRFEIYIDGNKIKECACATSDTWEYINSEIIASYDKVDNHTVTIKTVSENGKRVLISGIGVTS